MAFSSKGDKMKTYFISRILLAALSLCILVLCASCDKNISKQLHIENGSYAIVPSNGTDSARLALRFEYFATGQQCQVGGYGLAYDGIGAATDWYRMQTLTPNVRYAISDTFICSRTLSSNPKVTMQAYRIGSSESYPELKAECVLMPKEL
jgi:hypothetical protein